MTLKLFFLIYILAVKGSHTLMFASYTSGCSINKNNEVFNFLSSICDKYGIGEI